MLVHTKQREPKEVTGIKPKDELEARRRSPSCNVTARDARTSAEKSGPSAEDVEAKLHDAARQSFNMGGED